MNGLSKGRLLQLLEDIRSADQISNAELCGKFADEIYLPKIISRKAEIPLPLRAHFADLR